MDGVCGAFWQVRQLRGLQSLLQSQWKRQTLGTLGQLVSPVKALFSRFSRNQVRLNVENVPHSKRSAPVHSGALKLCFARDGAMSSEDHSQG